jgi:hypothetical protein
LPLSVIAMIICPIKIEMTDVLPKQICADCIEVLLTAYHLRDTSNQNDRYLRETVNEPLVKQEHFEDENPIFFDPSIYADDTRSDDEFFAQPRQFQNLSEPSAKGYTVDCFKNDNKSFVWKYFGALCDKSGKIVDKNFFYCVFCVQEDKLTRYSKQNATTCYLRHLHKIHNIVEPPKNAKIVEKKYSYEIYTCDLCGLEIRTKPSLRRHMMRRHDGERFGDDRAPPTNLYSDSDYIVDCYKSRKTSTSSKVWNFFGRLMDLEGNEVESGEGYHFCRLCNDLNILTKFAVTNATTGLMSHLVTKHGVSADPSLKPDEEVVLKQEPNQEFTNFSVNCYKAAVNKSYCWKYFGMLVDENKVPVESESEFLYCKICVSKGKTNKKFKRSCATTNLFFHLKGNHGITNERLEGDEGSPAKKSKRDEESDKTCSICCESFETRKAYFNHLRSVHNTIESSDYVCHVCSKTFSKNYILAKHMKIHSGIDYFCSLCPASFSYPEGLKRHEKIHDPSHLSKFQCDQCPNSYAERKSLKQHIMTVHLNKAKARNHRCEVCDMTFVTSNNLKRHVMKHTGEVRPSRQNPIEINVVFPPNRNPTNVSTAKHPTRRKEI